MPTSAPGNKAGNHRIKGDGGFTLVELMVVIVIIGLASAAAVLAMPDPRGRLADEAARFALRVKAARDAAIVAGRPTSVWVTSAGYGFDEWRAGGWNAIDQKPLRVTQWSARTTATLPDRVRVTFDTTGAADRPLAVPLLRQRARASVTIDATGEVRLDD